MVVEIELHTKRNKEIMYDAMKRTHYDTETNQHYFMDYSKAYKTTLVHTAPSYYNPSDDDTVIDFDEKIALIDTTGFDIKDTKKYKELQRKCMALVRGAVQLEKKEKLTWKY
jgi:hypothetical protein